MSETLAQRLGVQAGDRLLVLNAPERYLRLLDPPSDLHIDLGPVEGAVYDDVHLFTLDRGTVERESSRTLAALSPGTRFWVCFPQKGGTIITDLAADKGWDTFVDAGWRSTAQVPIDSDWAALRFEPAAG